MSLATSSSFAAAVMPLQNPSAIRRGWAVMGLPETGWILVTEKERCAVCPGEAIKPCIEACTAEHGLPVQARSSMGTCAQCAPAPCEESCPADAIHHTAQGVVEVDQELCIGCLFCVDACPNEALAHIDSYQTATPPHGLKDYHSGKPSGAMPNTVAKCTFCSDRLLQGEMSVCTEACPLGARWIGNLDRDTATNGRELVRLSELLRRGTVQLVPPGQRMVTLV